ncbi:MAG: hypothetical protein GF419_10910 [Ignavibacteriales bacterium]|nr:hypothetical protein [Ignavibacteriales bacterium]
MALQRKDRDDVAAVYDSPDDALERFEELATIVAKRSAGEEASAPREKEARERLRDVLVKARDEYMGQSFFRTFVARKIQRGLVESFGAAKIGKRDFDERRRRFFLALEMRHDERDAIELFLRMWAGVPLATEDLKTYSPYFPQEDAERVVADIRDADEETRYAAFAEIVGFEEDRTHDDETARVWAEETIDETIDVVFDGETKPDREEFRAFVAKALARPDENGGER